MRDEIRRVTTFTSGVAELTRFRAEELLGLIRTEMKHQIESLGLATARDLERLERRVARLEGRSTGKRSRKKTSPAKQSARRKTTARKTTAAGKTTRKKTAAGKTAGRGTPS